MFLSLPRFYVFNLFFISSKFFFLTFIENLTMSFIPQNVLTGLDFNYESD